MSNVVHLAASRPDEEVAAERFEAYRQAVERVSHTLDVQDGLAAGRAWRAFLDVFLNPGQRAALGSAKPGRLTQ